MEGGMAFDASSNITALLQNPSSEVLDSLWIPNSSPSPPPFHGEDNSASTMKPIFGLKEETCEEDYDKCFHQPEKKRRLTTDQVQFLEKSFEVENKLEPERKVQLAKELNLQPRQVAIWFQNRRARYKTKQLEKDYDVLKSNYDKLKLDFDCLQKDNEKLRHEVEMLTGKLLQREEGKEGSMPIEFPTKELELDSQKLLSTPISTENMNNEPKKAVCKQEDANSVSAKSDIIDSDSPHCTDGNHSSFLEPADSSNVFENQSDFSQDEEDDDLGKNILRFPKVEYESYIDHNEGSLGYPGEDQAFWFWP